VGTIPLIVAELPPDASRYELALTLLENVPTVPVMGPELSTSGVVMPFVPSSVMDMGYLNI
jgi:hypothetical protein